MRLRLVAALALTLVTAALAAAGETAALRAKPTPVGGAKSGTPIVPPAYGTARVLAASRASGGVLVALNRGSGGERLVRRAGATLLSPSLALWRVGARAAPRVLSALRRRGALRYAEPDIVGAERAGHWSLGDHLLNDQAELDVIRAGVEPPGPGMPITVIDTGLDGTHPEFFGRPNTFLLNPNAVPAREGEEHGTAVASVAAAPANGWGMVGVYPQARLHVFDENRDTCSSNVRAFAVAIRAARTGVINASWSFPHGACFALRDAVAEAFGVGTLTVASAGNQAEQGNPRRDPAYLPHVLTVAATDVYDRPTVFSNFNLGVDLAAPGQDILVAVPAWYESSRYTSHFELMNGTSFAAPMVAAATAWVWTVRPDLARTQIFNVMRWAARDVHTPGFDRQTGFGILDIASALQRAAPSVDPGEPNDDIHHVKANGLFGRADPGLTTPRRRRGALEALLDVTEDPVDVYRAWIPGRGGQMTITLTPKGENVDLEVFRVTAKTVYYKNRRRALRGPLIASSYRAGARVDRVSLQNPGRRGEYVYVAAYLPAGGPLDAEYALRVTTRR